MAFFQQLFGRRATQRQTQTPTPQPTGAPRGSLFSNCCAPKVSTEQEFVVTKEAPPESPNHRGSVTTDAPSAPSPLWGLSFEKSAEIDEVADEVPDLEELVEELRAEAERERISSSDLAASFPKQQKASSFLSSSGSTEERTEQLKNEADYMLRKIDGGQLYELFSQDKYVGELNGTTLRRNGGLIQEILQSADLNLQKDQVESLKRCQTACHDLDLIVKEYAASGKDVLNLEKPAATEWEPEPGWHRHEKFSLGGFFSGKKGKQKPEEGKIFYQCSKSTKEILIKMLFTVKAPLHVTVQMINDPAFTKRWMPGLCPPVEVTEQPSETEAVQRMKLSFFNGIIQQDTFTTTRIVDALDTPSQSVIMYSSTPPEERHAYRGTPNRTWFGESKEAAVKGTVVKFTPEFSGLTPQQVAADAKVMEAPQLAGEEPLFSWPETDSAKYNGSTRIEVRLIS
uniref:START domain-containing protein n=1 Tax=Chromera velia CCMP2878 TaxID=1169474 RepID=A0A0K6S752_9ALVE|eukprot:Cvel_20628.t1-p1 / transcript=Cvel_20628.t1 / gene=Cvel_20628 / organism=Chromera_velia_CCMP2878 / gene_product=hypothetical protein / transcript_product=hypothetical protein / location=Cvel_scaffold1869:23098-25516(+) / protein_length=454 / sequence_SO=supercontig / SO=protein_coding / is_pseudo=false